ncbi:MAG: DUF1738 domain-containing protein [Acidobacteria bacterium]|nr:DUF1738 domain-containing protein [Acidobacteriota bacterium]
MGPRRDRSQGNRASGSCRTTSAAGATLAAATPATSPCRGATAGTPTRAGGGYRQIQEAGGHVRKGEKGTPIMYVEWRQQQTARDDNGNPVLDDEGRKKLEWVQRDRPVVKLHYVFNVEQTEGLKLRSLAEAAPEWEGHERAEALIRSSGVRVDHVAGDRAYYSLKDDRVVLPDRSQFESQSAYTHTALHELGHATGHPDRLNRSTLVKHDGFGSEAYAREELRAEVAAMMTGEQLGVGHEPRHGAAYVSSWIKALENDPKETRAEAVDAQRIAECLIARARAKRGRREGGACTADRRAGHAPEHRNPERSPSTVPHSADVSSVEHDAPPRAPSPSRQATNPPAVRDRLQEIGPPARLPSESRTSCRQHCDQLDLH